MYSLNEVAQAYSGIGTDYTRIYRYLVELLDRRDDLVLQMLASEIIVLYDGWDYRVNETGMQELHRLLTERGI